MFYAAILRLNMNECAHCILGCSSVQIFCLLLSTMLSTFVLRLPPDRRDVYAITPLNFLTYGTFKVYPLNAYSGLSSP